jgi:PKD repeat protein
MVRIVTPAPLYAAHGGLAGKVKSFSPFASVDIGQQTAPNVALSPTGYGIVDVTRFYFDASGGSVNPATFLWSFGDGSSASGPNVSHIYATVGTYTVRLRATGASGEAVTTRTVTVGTITGNWFGPAGGGVDHRLLITQQGAVLSGQWIVTFEPGSPFGTTKDTIINALAGTLSSPRSLTIEQLGECRRTITDGLVTVDLSGLGGSGFYGNSACGGTGFWNFVRQP